MRKSDAETLLDYMYWVNALLLDAAERLAGEAYLASTAGTTRDLRETLVHELDVEWSWRLNLLGRPMEEIGPEQDLRPEDFPDVASLRERWRTDEVEMRAWLAGLSDDDVERDVWSEFSADSRPLWQYLLHIVMHAAQQQADAATALSLAGQSPGEIGFLEYLKRAGEPSPSRV